jgi:DNA-binding MarR family transcriptional regulator
MDSVKPKKTEIPDKEIEILQQIFENPEEVHQRDLARIAGLSLGMTNAILKRLAQKGLLTIRKVNNRNIRYVVSAKGAEEIARKSYRYFKRTIKNVTFYRRAIEDLVRKVKAKGYDGLVLVGVSDLDFIVEHACQVGNVRFVRDDRELTGNEFTLYSEHYIPDEETKAERNEEPVIFLQDVLMVE